MYRLALCAAVVGLGLAGCAETVVTPGDPGFVALNNGDYEKARDVFVDEYAKHPHDPFVELDLGLAYQNLGRMDLAEPLYRQVLVDGRNVVPMTTTTNQTAGVPLDQIACRNLKIGLHNPTAC
jgi:tetratricopeptide (TPR) repeat protein